MMTGVRRYLGSDCKAQRPNEAQLLHALLIEVQAFNTEASLTGQAWSVGEYLLNVAPGQGDYTVPISTSFGKPLHIVTYYPVNPSTIEREIDIFEVQDLNVDWPYPQNLAQNITNWDGQPNTAMRIAFFYNGPQAIPTFRVRPIPALAAQYKVLYILGDIASFMQLQTVPILSLFHFLIEIRTAIQLLPYAEWFDEDDRNSNRRKEIATALADIRGRYQDQFSKYMKSTTLCITPNYRRTYAI